MSLREKSQDFPAPYETADTADSSIAQKDTSTKSVLSPTYSELLDLALEGCDEAQAKQKRLGIAKWFEATGLGPNDHVGDEFGSEFEYEVNKLRELFTASHNSKYSGNIASVVRGIQKLYIRELNQSGLPAGFKDLILFGLKKTGKKIHGIRTKVSATAEGWAQGKSSPRATSNVEIVKKLEDYLELPTGSLIARMPKPASRVANFSKDIPYRRYVGKINSLKNGLMPDFEKLSCEVQKAINLLIEHKKQRRHLLPTGLVSVRVTETWNSEETIKMRVSLFRRFFGYLALPLPTKPLDQLPWEDRIQHGLGLPLESLRFTMLLDQKYLLSYMDFCELRSFDEEHFANEERRKQGLSDGNNLKKTLPGIFEVFLGCITNLVNKEHSFLAVHTEFSKEVGVDVKEWQAWLSNKHGELMRLRKVASSNVKEGKRSSKFDCSEMLRQEVPVESMYKMLEKMRLDTPPRETSPSYHATHLRGIAVISLTLWDPVRCKNIISLEIGRHIKYDEQGCIKLEIPASEMKNYIWGHAQSRSRVLPEDVAKDVINWMDARNELPISGVREFLFCRFDDRSQALQQSGLSYVFKFFTTRYIGLGIGPHAFRLLVGQTVSKLGTVAQVRAILNDSEKVALEHYTDARNADQFNGLDALHQMVSKPTVKKGDAK